jgi:oxygen-independent coproporphyrinogen III oxidase
VASCYDAYVSAFPRAAYIHVPFCRHRCGYCDFPLITGRDDLIEDYQRAILLELQSLGTPREVDTLFFGGGTPTHLSPDHLRQLLDVARKWLPLAEGYEFSVEANPRDLDDDRIGVLREAGVNRLSLGVQSFGNSQLAVLERDHQAEEIAPLLERLSRAGIENTSLDLIFGVPGQSSEDWGQTLQQARGCSVRHISAYGLTYEKGTSFWRRRASGTLRPVEEERERQMYALAMDLLPAAGFHQYEISNYAAPGYECRHNLVYWRGEAYLAFGPGAARYVAGVRSTNHRSVTTWLKRVLAGESPVAETETLDNEERARELIMLGLRTTAGIDVAAFEQRTGFDLHALCGPALERFTQGCLLEESAGSMRLTREGRFLADTVTSEFL